jgi:hypothetical protein
VRSVGFVTDHLSTQTRPLTAFVPDEFQTEFLLVGVEAFTFAPSLHPSQKYDYVLTDLQTDRYVLVKDVSYPQAVTECFEHGNRLYDSGFSKLTCSPSVSA